MGALVTPCELLECYISHVDKGTPLTLGVRISHRRDNRGKDTVSWYSKNIQMQEDNSGPTGRRWQCWWEKIATARSEDLLLQATHVAQPLQGDALRLLAWQRLQGLATARRQESVNDGDDDDSCL